jgi:hypothetical protein
LVDVARVVGALLIVSRHVLDYPEWSYSWSLGGRVGLFFLLAGYFCRFDLSYRKMTHKVVWLIIPLILWNLITVGLGLGGLQDITVKSLTGMGGSDMYPADVPLWFLFSIVLYTLCVPAFRLCSAYKWIVLAVLLILDLTSGRLFSSLYLLKFFSGLTPFYVGLLLSQVSLPRIERELATKHRDWVLVGLALVLLQIPALSVGYVQTFLGIAVIGAVSSLLVRYLKRFSGFLARHVAPAGFLIFALHDLLLWTVFSAPRFHDNALLRFSIPYLCVGGIALIYAILKRYASWSLPLIAHRPPTLGFVGIAPRRWMDFGWTCLFFVPMFSLLHVAPSRFSVTDYQSSQEEPIVVLPANALGTMKLVGTELESGFVEVPTHLMEKTTVSWTMQMDQDCVLKLYYCPASRQTENYQWAEAIEFGQVSAKTPKTFVAELPAWMATNMRLKVVLSAEDKEKLPRTVQFVGTQG